MTKPLDTPISEFTDAEVDAMDDEEIFARTCHTSGDLGAVVSQIAIEAAHDMVQAVEQAQAVADVLGEDAEALIAVSMANLMHSIAVSAISVGRDVERFAVANPDFPDSEPEGIRAMMARKSEAHAAQV